MSLSIPIRQESLPNGLRIVLSEDHTAPVVAVNLWYGVGSRNEVRGRTGFAHLFEHMMFQGSAHVPKNRHFELVERAGGSLNASTWFDRTNYYETMPSHHLELALWLESDRMGWMLPAMTQEKLDNQREVVKNERRWRYDNRPYGDWDERIQSLAYPPDHPYHHTVIGSMEDIDTATLEDVEDFFRTFYVPNNAVLSLCGDFEASDALGLIDRYFGEIPSGRVIPVLPGQPQLDLKIGATVREDVVAKVPLPRVYVACRVPPYTDPAFPTAEVLTAVLGSGRASRLYRALVDEQKIAKDVSAYVFPLITGATLLIAWATGYPEVGVERLEAAVLAEMDGLGEVGAPEVARAVSLAETSYLRSLEKVGDKADLFSMFEMIFGEPERVRTEIDRLRAVGEANASAFAREYLGADNRAVVTYVPRSEP